MHAIEVCAQIKNKKGTLVENVFQTSFGALKVFTLVGQSFGSKVELSRGWAYVLQPTPELWTQTLPHRTQITAYHRDVCELGFDASLNGSADAVFLDLPAPQTAVPHAIRALKASGPTTKPSPRPKKQNKTNKSPPSLPRQKKPAQKKPEGCSSCGAKDHTRRSSKKCANYIKPQRNRFAPQGSSIPNVTWNMKTGFPKFCKERAIFEKINLDVIECSALATEASIYVHWYCMRLLREDEWPVEEYGLNHVLDFSYHLQGKRQAKERVELDESYFAQRQTDRVYDGKLRTFLIQGLAKQYLTVWKNCITINLCKRLAKYGHLFIDDKMSIYEWRVKIEQHWNWINRIVGLYDFILLDKLSISELM